VNRWVWIENVTSLFGLSSAESDVWSQRKTQRKTNPKSEVTQCVLYVYRRHAVSDLWVLFVVCVWHVELRADTVRWRVIEPAAWSSQRIQLHSHLYARINQSITTLHAPCSLALSLLSLSFSYYALFTLPTPTQQNCRVSSCRAMWTESATVGGNLEMYDQQSSYKSKESYVQPSRPVAVAEKCLLQLAWSALHGCRLSQTSCLRLHSHWRRRDQRNSTMSSHCVSSVDWALQTSTMSYVNARHSNDGSGVNKWWCLRFYRATLVRSTRYGTALYRNATRRIRCERNVYSLIIVNVTTKDKPFLSSSIVSKVGVTWPSAAPVIGSVVTRSKNRNSYCKEK